MTGVNPRNLDPAVKWLRRAEAAKVWGDITPDGFSSLVSKGYAPEADDEFGGVPVWDEAKLIAAYKARPGRGNPRKGQVDKPDAT